MIETLAVVAILAILMTMSIFTFMTQLTKGRDARRKADLEKMKTVLEDYMNDSSCYPDDLLFGENFAPYLSQLPADPLDNTYYNYFYSFDVNSACKNWYKIYAKLENTADPIIIKVGCRESTECPLGGCGPSCNYNYWVSSPNMDEVNQIPTAEDWWLPVATLPPAAPTSTPRPTNTPPIVSTPTPTPIPGPTSTPPPAGGPTSTPAPTPTPGGFFGFYGCKEGDCVEIWGICPQAGEEGNCECPNANYRLSDCGGQCVNPPNQCH